MRRLENLLQAMADKQTQTLPESEVEQLQLAVAMGYQGWDELHTEVQRHMSQVHSVFAELIGDDDEEQQDVAKHFVELWDMAAKQDVLEHILEHDIQAHDPQSMASTIIQFKQDLAKKTLGPRGREVLNHLMPKVFAAIYSHKDAQFGLPRVLHLLHRIVTRTTYLELLDEHSAALTQLVRLCTASPMISEQLGRYPIFAG
ncbi:hypothetical protein QW180_12940 [Vibrio sinaloensis]|nr:hypothetical protein [Vibrio sinaloensis]